ncbi:hypothetical protein Tel_11370 [Candidatus Tenderia electrophaga]|uniref:Uncharacterized protein n=1 Tax=Candidatus Tenderia electrophaga TaxID=1748243 RepID=A0A0S2TEU2_9GAMM|nr:hypothetical protein Tel_11370 [Candidatus Tenderia electrophaga]
MTDEQETVAPVSPQTQALSLYIQNAIQQLRNSAPHSTDRRDEDQQSSLIFFGNWQDPYPRLLVTDPILEPVDKVVWQIIRTHITTPGAVTAFPNYGAIRAGANVKSNHTVSRAITILRATRWLSLCERVRDTQGRFLGNIYALHDEPVTLGDAMYLDSDYIEFLRNSQNHKHLRVGRVARSVLATIQDMIDVGKDAIGERVQTWTYERRIGLFARERKDTPVLQLAKHNPFYALSDPHIAALNEQNPDTGTSLPDARMGDETEYTQVQKTHMVENDEHNRVQNLHLDANIASPPRQNTHTDVCSSSSNNINTTTTNKHLSRACARLPEFLHFPPRISDNERNLAMMYLTAIDDSLQQDVLDEWHGRLSTGTKRGTPIENPIGYLAVLCQRAKTGEFQLTIGLRIREAREREQEHKRRMKELDKRNDEKTLALLQKHSGSAANRMSQRLEEIRSGQKKQESES